MRITAGLLIAWVALVATPVLAIASGELEPSRGGVAIIEEEVEHYPSGVVRSRCRLDREGRRNGTYVEYYEDGATRIKARYRGGELAGKYESFHPDGERWISAAYKAGLLQGKYVDRRPDGKTVFEGKYEKGSRQGTWALKRGGKVRQEQEWVDDALVRIDGALLHPKGLEAVWTTLARIHDPDTDWGGPNAKLLEDPSGEETEDTEEHVEDRRLALRRLMAYRFLCDVPWEDMELSPRFNYYTTVGARLLEEINQLTHWPKNPGWPKDRFRDAYRGTSSSNLAYTRSMQRSVDSYMGDSDAMNIAHVGHRSWCLTPELEVTGFGRSGRVTGMWVKDESRTEGVDYEVILYPPRGWVPTEYFDARHAWSVELNPANHGFPQVGKIEPEIQPLDADYFPVGEPLELDHLGVHEHTVIFRPAELDVSAGSRYLARIHGVRSGKVGSALTYLVEFVDPPAPAAEADGR